MKKLFEDLKGKDVVEISTLVSSSMKVKKESGASDARPEGDNLGNIVYTSSPINLSLSSDSGDELPLLLSYPNLQKANLLLRSHHVNLSTLQVHLLHVKLCGWIQQ